MEMELKEQSVVDCIYDVGEKVDLKDFLNSNRNPYPIYFIAEAICMRCRKILQNIKDYIRSNIDECDTVDKLRYILGNVFDVSI